MKDFRIEAGREAYIKDLMRCIHDLARFEKAPKEVVNNETELSQDYKDKAFDFIVALVNNQVVGISLFYPRYSTWKGRCFYLEDLYVDPEQRGKGIGKALLEATAEIARQRGAKRLDWQVLDWNSSAVAFYESMGAEVEKEWWNCKWWLQERTT